jgi:hypothetical protein
MPKRLLINDNTPTGHDCGFPRPLPKNAFIKNDPTDPTLDYDIRPEFGPEENENKFPSEDGGVEHFG